MRKLLYCILTLILCCTCFAACAEQEASQSAQQQTSSANANSIEFVENEVTITAGKSLQLEVVTSKQNVYVFWETRDENIATVTDEGLITGVAAGQTICYASFGGVKAICLVKVLAATAAPMLSITTPYTEGVTLSVGDTFDPLLSVKMGDDVVDDAEIEYSVAEAGVVGVENGKIVALGVGNATVSVSVVYGEESASLSIPVSVVALS